MRTLTDLKIEPDQIPWLSTHPNHIDREKKLNELLPEALQFRNKVGVSKQKYVFCSMLAQFEFSYFHLSLVPLSYFLECFYLKCILLLFTTELSLYFLI